MTSGAQNISEPGTHWSLLLWDKSRNSFYHFDSLDNRNFPHAKLINERLTIFYNAAAKPSLTIVKPHRETNSVDCGIHSYLMCTTSF